MTNILSAIIVVAEKMISQIKHTTNQKLISIEQKSIDDANNSIFVNIQARAQAHSVK